MLVTGDGVIGAAPAETATSNLTLLTSTKEGGDSEIDSPGIVAVVARVIDPNGHPGVRSGQATLLQERC